MKIIELEKELGDFHMKIEKLSIETGKIHGIIGGNGCGKTTLCKLIMGILEADKGRIDWEGIDPKRITMTAQRPYFIQSSVYENICYPLKIRHEKPDEALIDWWLEQCGLLQKTSVCQKSFQRRAAESFHDPGTDLQTGIDHDR